MLFRSKRGISLDNAFFTAPELAAVMGQQVYCRQDEADLGALHVFDLDGNYICRALDHTRLGINRAELNDGEGANLRRGQPAELLTGELANGFSRQRLELGCRQRADLCDRQCPDLFARQGIELRAAQTSDLGDGKRSDLLRRQAGDLGFADSPNLQRVEGAELVGAERRLAEVERADLRRGEGGDLGFRQRCDIVRRQVRDRRDRQLLELRYRV